MLEFVTLFFYFSLVIMFFNNLPDFSAKKYFFLPYHICKQFIMSFQILHTVFFQYFSHPPLEK